MVYTNLYNRNRTPQSEAIPGREQDMSRNNAGGYSFVLDNWKQLDRFLILGSDTPTYYVGAREMTRNNAKNIEQLIREDGQRVLDTVVDVSTNGRAYKNEPALFVLALAITMGSDKVKSQVKYALVQVARTGTHLFQFVNMANDLRGWGSALKKAVAHWYTQKDAQKLAYQVTKYQQREGWSHRDLLRKAHPVVSGEVNAVLQYVTHEDRRHELLVSAPENSGVADYLSAVEDIKRVTTARKAANLVRAFNLPREVIPTEFLNSVEVWEALLNPSKGRYMPITAMIRNLGSLTSKGVLKPLGSNTRIVVDRLLDAEVLKNGRVHPIQILAAMLTYAQGHGVRGALSWTPVREIVDALDEAFYLSFGAVEPTNKRRLMALDISGSMTYGDIAGIPGLTPNVASAALAMVSARTERYYDIMGFSTNFIDLGISPRQRLDDVVRKTRSRSFGGTDCALPMKYALSQGIEVDSFEVYTDNETWAGFWQHPVQALNDYRKKTGIPATLTVVGMTATNFSIADPQDAGMLDVVGFDTAAPNVISDFIARRI